MKYPNKSKRIIMIYQSKTNKVMMCVIFYHEIEHASTEKNLFEQVSYLAALSHITQTNEVELQYYWNT